MGFFFLVSSVLSVVFWATAVHAQGSASESDCLDALQRCYDYNIFAIKEFVFDFESTTLNQACLLYSNSLRCIQSLPCKQTAAFKQKSKKLTNSLYKEVAGICLANGARDPCFEKLLDCESHFQIADNELSQHNTNEGCLEIAAFDKCTKEAMKSCSGVAVADEYSNWETLNKDAYREGCDVNCNDALSECTYELEVADATDKDDYCEALGKTKTCLENTQTDVHCSSTDSQRYLDKAVKQKASKYATLCDGVQTIAGNLVLCILAASVVSVVLKVVNDNEI